MTEQELRALVRDAVARHLGRPSQDLPPAPRAAQHAMPQPVQRPSSLHQPDFSHSLYIELVNVTDACLIEPAVTCTHCGYCQSHGH
jgi:hypothetical protein